MYEKRPSAVERLNQVDMRDIMRLFEDYKRTE